MPFKASELPSCVIVMPSRIRSEICNLIIIDVRVTGRMDGVKMRLATKFEREAVDTTAASGSG